MNLLRKQPLKLKATLHLSKNPKQFLGKKAFQAHGGWPTLFTMGTAGRDEQKLIESEL